MGSDELPEGHAEYRVVVDLSSGDGRAVAAILDDLRGAHGVSHFAYRRRRSEFATNDDLRMFLRTRGVNSTDASIIWGIVVGHRIGKDFGVNPDVWWWLACETYCAKPGCGRPRWGDGSCECSQFYFNGYKHWRTGHPWKVSVQSLINHAEIYDGSAELESAIGGTRVTALCAWVRSLEMGR